MIRCLDSLDVHTGLGSVLLSLAQILRVEKVLVYVVAGQPHRDQQRRFLMLS